MAYDSTKVPVEKSQSEIRKLLLSSGASRFVFGEEDRDGVHWVAIEFVHDGHAVRMQVPLKTPDDRPLREKARRATSRTYEQIRAEAFDQEARRVWRVLFWSLKARMVAVEEGLESFEQAFLAHLVDPATGATVWQSLSSAVAIGSFREGGMGLLAIEAPRDDSVVDAEVLD